MLLRYFFCFFSLFTYIFSNTLHSQVTLDGFIGLAEEPADDDEVCEIPMFPEVDDFLDDLLEGDLIPDFKLYTADGEAVQASEILGEKPALFVSGSYTCFVFRDEIDALNMLEMIYGDVLHIYVIYTVEAHPIEDPSPYYGVENVGEPNYEEGVLYEQPGTYGERKVIIDSMLNHYEVNVPILIDGPCNEWWTTFGTNPNCAFLVAPDGIVFDAQDWFDRYPDDILASINSLFEIYPPDSTVIDSTGTDTTETIADGAFLATFDSECITGLAGETIIAHGSVINADTIAASFVDVIVFSETLPDGWESSICTDICYPPDVVVATAYADIGDTTDISVYFFTNETPGEGIVDIIIKNHYVTGTAELFTVKACVEEIDDDTSNYIVSMQQAEMFVYPNPAYNMLTIYTDASFTGDKTIRLLDMSGRLLLDEHTSSSAEINVNIENIPGGVYTIEVKNAQQKITRKIVIE
jgi:hypothetical protein